MGMFDRHPSLQQSINRIEHATLRLCLTTLVEYHDAVASGDKFAKSLFQSLLDFDLKNMSPHELGLYQDLAKIIEIYAKSDDELLESTKKKEGNTIYAAYDVDPKWAPVGSTWYNKTKMALRIQTPAGPVDVVDDPTPHVDEMMAAQKAHEHTHRDNQGLLHKCYHKCRSLFSWQFFVGITLSFPIEHALWTKVPGFYHLADLLGLGIGHH